MRLGRCWFKKLHNIMSDNPLQFSNSVPIKAWLSASLNTVSAIGITDHLFIMERGKSNWDNP